MSILLALAAAASTPLPPQASIPFFNSYRTADWRADGDRGLWLRPIGRQWYYASFAGPCIDLHWSDRLAFDTRPNGTFDRFSSVVTEDGNRCIVDSLTKSDAPPRKAASARAARSSRP